MQQVKNARFYTSGADEGSDISNEEQPVVVRYVDAEGQIREDFPDFVKCDMVYQARHWEPRFWSTLDHWIES